MIIIPAIDIMGGKVVRLVQGEASRQTVYSASPVDVAERWALAGAELIHVVDLDGAFSGRLENLAVAREIAKSVDVDVEFGGGIRDEEAIARVLDAGVKQVSIGTKALDPAFLMMIGERFGDKVVISVDARDGIVYSKGWVQKTETSVIDLVHEASDAGIRRINYTDISRDGTLEGPNLESLKKLLSATVIDVVVGGGISTIDDLKRIRALGRKNLAGVIIGKALYEKTISLVEAIRLCEGQGELC